MVNDLDSSLKVILANENHSRPISRKIQHISPTKLSLQLVLLLYSNGKTLRRFVVI